MRHGWRSSSSGVRTRFVCPSRGPPVRSPPPPPSASPSTIGTAGGRVACLVLVFLSLPTEPGTQKQGTRHSTPAAAPSVTGTAGRRAAHFLLVFLFRLPGIELGSSGLQPAAQPLLHAARNPPCEPLAPTKHPESVWGDSQISKLSPIACTSIADCGPDTAHSRHQLRFLSPLCFWPVAALAAGLRLSPNGLSILEMPLPGIV